MSDARRTRRARTDDGLAAWTATWRAAMLAAREIESAMRDAADLSLTWSEVLARLGAAEEGRLPMSELARQVFVSRSGISQVVTAMAREGLVERQDDPENLRTTYAVITDDGREVLAESTAAFRSAVREHFGRHLDPDETRTITAALDRVVTALGATPARDPRA